MTDIPWAIVSSWLTALRQQNERSIALRRGSTTLTAQSMRVERSGQRQQQQVTPGGLSYQQNVVIIGATTLDIQPQDRFTLDGILYEVDFVHPLRLACTQADAKAIE